MKAVLLAAGKGTRCWPLTDTRPKPLLPVANRTLIHHNLDALDGLVDEVIIIVKHMQDQIRAAVGDSYKSMKVTYVEQESTLGTGHALLYAEKSVGGERFLLINGDDIYSRSDLEALARHEFATLAQEVPPHEASRFGIFVEKDGKAVDLIEKPANPPTNLASTGAFAFGPAIFDAIRRTPVSAKGELYLSDAVRSMIHADPGSYALERVRAHWLSIGYCWHLLDANSAILDTMASQLKDCDIKGMIYSATRIFNNVVARSGSAIEPFVTIKGPVWIGERTVIKAGAYIEGPALIGRDCSIGPNCHIRPYTTIGDDCKIGQAVEVKNSILLPHASLPHRNYVGDSVIGSRVNFGVGADTTNVRLDKGTVWVKFAEGPIAGQKTDSGRRKLGAIVGDGVQIAGHVRLKPGSVLAPNAPVGQSNY